jgi:DNA-binding Xre family transcriptional regulator
MQDLELRSNLKRILREKSMSQLELARQINISPTNLNTRLARGRNCQLSLVESICNALSIQVSELMYGDAVIVTEAEKPQTGDTMIELLKAKDDTIRSLQKTIELLEEKITFMVKTSPQSHKKENGGA